MWVTLFTCDKFDIFGVFDFLTNIKIIPNVIKAITPATIPKTIAKVL